MMLQSDTPRVGDLVEFSSVNPEQPIVHGIVLASAQNKEELDSMGYGMLAITPESFLAFLIFVDDQVVFWMGAKIRICSRFEASMG